MRKRLIMTLSGVVLTCAGAASAESATDRLAWWTQDRFGMFIHFGVYAIPARGEWVKSREHMADADYDAYFRDFNPDLFDAREWARTAKAAGMKYMVLTTKHHDGFCLFDSKFTDYKITKTPFGRDLVREYVEACRAEGLKVGFYYSLLDWHHPDYTVDERHPQRPICPPDGVWTDENRAAFARLNSRSVYGCTAAPDGFKAPEGTELTYNPKTNRLYIHLLTYPACGLYVAFPDRIARAAFLHDGSELKCRPFDFAGHANELGDTKENDTALGVIALPTVQPSVEVPVVELVLK